MIFKIFDVKKSFLKNFFDINQEYNFFLKKITENACKDKKKCVPLQRANYKFLFNNLKF